MGVKVQLDAHGRAKQTITLLVDCVSSNSVPANRNYSFQIQYTKQMVLGCGLPVNMSASQGLSLQLRWLLTAGVRQLARDVLLEQRLRWEKPHVVIVQSGHIQLLIQEHVLHVLLILSAIRQKLPTNALNVQIFIVGLAFSGETVLDRM